jgi:hypothetical protein
MSTLSSDGIGLADLPELHQGALDLPTLRQLLDDLALCAEIVEVRSKGGPIDHADPEGTFEDARRAFERRAVRGMQVRYRWEGDEWIDTLLWASEGPRLVRMRAPAR